MMYCYWYNEYLLIIIFIFVIFVNLVRQVTLKASGTQNAICHYAQAFVECYLFGNRYSKTFLSRQLSVAIIRSAKTLTKTSSARYQLSPLLEPIPSNTSAKLISNPIPIVEGSISVAYLIRNVSDSASRFRWFSKRSISFWTMNSSAAAEKFDVATWIRIAHEFCSTLPLF